MEKREIKFRAWDFEFTKMYGDSETKEMLMRQSLFDNQRQGGHDYSVTNFFMQYSGVKDMNECEIWEGDILELPIGEINNKYRYKVLFEDGAFVAYHTKLKDGFGKPQRWGLISQFNLKDLQVEVIGNVFENPNLCDGKI